jgi:hypothetical protein
MKPVEGITRSYFHPLKKGRAIPVTGRTPTASRQASRHETKETKADVSIMTQTDVLRFL